METDVVVKPRDVMPEGARTLPAVYYTDDTYFRREMERLFARMWVYAGRVEQVEREVRRPHRDPPGHRREQPEREERADDAARPAKARAARDGPRAARDRGEPGLQSAHLPGLDLDRGGEPGRLC